MQRNEQIALRGCDLREQLNNFAICLLTYSLSLSSCNNVCFQNIIYFIYFLSTNLNISLTAIWAKFIFSNTILTNNPVNELSNFGYSDQQTSPSTSASTDNTNKNVLIAELDGAWSSTVTLQHNIVVTKAS